MSVVQSVQVQGLDQETQGLDRLGRDLATKVKMRWPMGQAGLMHKATTPWVAWPGQATVLGYRTKVRRSMCVR